MAGPFALDGYDVLGPLGARERAWRAVCLADGSRVVLRRWVGAAAQVVEVRRRAALWGSVAGRGQVPVRDVVVVDDDLVVITDLAEGGSLDAVLTRRSALTAGQVVTLVAPLAQTLASVHEHGLMHGRISSGNVVLDGEGRPLLTDWTIAGAGDPAADVAALVALALRCLADDAPAAVVSAVRSGQDASTLAHDLLTAVAAEPLLTPSASDRAAVYEAPAVRMRGVPGAIAVVTVAVLIAVCGGVLWGRHDSAAGGGTVPRLTIPGSTTPTPQPPSARRAVDWLQVVQALERRRASAFTDVDVTALADGERRGTALWRHDARALSRLNTAHAHARGLHVRVQSAQIQSLQDERIVVRVIDALSSYDIVDEYGAVLMHHDARRPRPSFIALTQRDSGWVIDGVSRRSR